MNSVLNPSQSTPNLPAFLKVLPPTWIKTSLERPHKALITNHKWIWTTISITKAQTIMKWILINWVSHITWLIISQIITISIQIIITFTTTMLKTWLRTSSSTLTALQTANLKLRMSCLNMLWTPQWALHSSNIQISLQRSLQWIPILSNQKTSTNSQQILFLSLMIMSSKRVLWLTTRPLIHTEIKAQLIWRWRTREIPRTLRRGSERDQLQTRMVKDWEPQTSSIRLWLKLSKVKTVSSSL